MGNCLQEGGRPFQMGRGDSDQLGTGRQAVLEISSAARRKQGSCDWGSTPAP